MKKVSLIFLLISLKANAWQLNPSYILNSPNSENCIGATYKIGDKIASAAGSENYALVKSISGTSTRCQQDPSRPILANTEMIVGASSKFIMEIPDDFKASTIADIYKWSGIALAAVSDKGGARELFVYFRQREATISPEAIMQATITGITISFKDAPITKNQEELLINGMKAWRYEVIGTSKGIFAPSITYQYTMLEGESEYIIVNASTKTANYEEDKQNMYTYAYKVSGIKSNPKSEASVSTTESSQIENAKQKCVKLGFKEKTEKFGVCVLEFIK